MVKFVQMLFPLLFWSFAEGDGDGGGDDPPPEGDGGDGGGAPDGRNEPGPIPYDRFKEVNERAKTAEQRAKDLEAKLAEIEDSKKTETEKLAEQVQTIQQQLKQERDQRMRAEVINETGLPAAFADRIRGDDKDAMLEDAQALKEFIKPSEGPGVPPTGRGGEPKTPDLSSMSPDEIREARKEGKLPIK